MQKTGFLYDDRYRRHDTGPYHPETAERLPAIYRGIREAGLLPRLHEYTADLPERRWVELVHDPGYVDRFQEACRAGKRILDSGDNRMCPETFETAMLAVGGVLKTLDLVMNGTVRNAFCAVRPPGHHAERDRAMGFCYLNNVAVGARYLQQRWGVARVGIVDFDVHHGNGTQHIFESDASVLYYSIHQHPSFTFPGTGREFERGAGPGLGFTHNSPVLPGQGDAEYRRLLERDLFPVFESFQPEFVLVSTGFDGHEKDDMADMRLSDEGLAWIMEHIVAMADGAARGRLVSVLEGGYNLERLPELAARHVEILLEA